MPDEGVSDLRDVVDAINKLCETMKTSTYDEVCDDEAEAERADTISCTASLTSFSQDTVSCYSHDAVEQTQYAVDDSTDIIDQSHEAADRRDDTVAYSQDAVDHSLGASVAASLYESSVDTFEPETEIRCAEYRDIEIASPGEATPQKAENNAERWSDSTSQVSLPGQVEDVETVTSDTEPAMAPCEPVSEMYYTASSEVSLLSDTELPEKVAVDNEDKDAKDDRKECVIAGHVAAMRERFESMTRTNTPCPDLARSLSPSLEVFRNTSPSPDRLA